MKVFCMLHSIILNYNRYIIFKLHSLYPCSVPYSSYSRLQFACVFYTLPSIFFTLFTLYLALYILPTLYFILYTLPSIFFTLYTVYFYLALYIMHSVPCPLSPTLYPLYHLLLYRALIGLRNLGAEDDGILWSGLVTKVCRVEYTV